jgi:hypothetical protein
VDSPAAQPDPNAQAKQESAQLRAYLPALLQKTLLEIEREEVAGLERLLKFFQAHVAGGTISQDQVDQIEQELLRGRIRVLQRETAYRDALDPFKLRFDAAPERLRKMEEATLLPLRRHLQRFEEITGGSAAILGQMEQQGDLEKAATLRAVLKESLTASAKGTPFQQEILRRWAAWQGLGSSHDRAAQLLLQLAGLGLAGPTGLWAEPPGLAVLLSPSSSLLRLEALRRERTDLKDGLEALRQQGQPVPPDQEERLRWLQLGIDLGMLEARLRAYEEQPWLREATPPEQWRSHASLFQRITFGLALVLSGAQEEQLRNWEKTWPAVPPVRLDGVDLLAGALEKAEQIVAARRPKPDEALAGKASLRQVRSLAQTYRIQQRALQLANVERERSLEEFRAPAEPGASGETAARLTQRLLTAQGQSKRARTELFRTWINYQAARLDLYRDLGLPPP